MRTSTGSNHEAREAVGRILNLLLADEYFLYQITRDYHWNVRGPDFFSLRLQFQMQHDASTAWVDEVTERIRLLRLDERISWDDLKESVRCAAASGFGLPAEAMITGLLRAHEDIIAQLRSDIEVCRFKWCDASTAGFLAGLVEQHENSAWMLRAQLEIPEANSAQFTASLN
jgi:starvation-inducible DNA-binding protein